MALAIAKLRVGGKCGCRERRQERDHGACLQLEHRILLVCISESALGVLQEPEGDNLPTVVDGDYRIVNREASCDSPFGSSSPFTFVARQVISPR
jgi:hypothetical protein